MIEAHPCLSDSALAAIARNELDDVELRSCERHLECCGACREQLEMRSADATIWQSAREFLPDDQFDQQRFGCGDERTEVDDSGGAAQLLKFLAPTDDPHMLGRLGSYEVSGIVGAGGMGIVLKAFEPSLARFVALKVLAPSFWSDPQARQRFAREARAAASIVHDNVIEIYGVDEVNGIPFFAMPYLRGDTLQARIDRQGPFGTEETLRVAMQVASGLAAAHAQGLVHRDIKPTNILLGTGAERVRITDFGIAHSVSDPHLTQSGFVAGTPQFMSPEQVRGEGVDGRTDLFSLGSVMYAMCAGRPPFQADSNYELLHRIVSSEFTPLETINPAIPDWLAAIVAKLLRPDPSDRYQSAEELAQQLEQCLASLQPTANVERPKTVTRLEAKYRRQRRSNARRILWGGFFMGICSIAIIGLAILMNGLAPETDAAKSIKVHGQVVNDQGAPIAGVTVLAVQKTWPNNRYQQQMLKTTTDNQGRFQFEQFAVPGKQYAFLLTVVSDRWLMTSEYRVVKDGAQQDPVVLRTAQSQPVTIQFVYAAGKPISKVRALPSGRVTKDGKEYLSYPQQVMDAGVTANKDGEVPFGSWLPGERGAIVYLVDDQIATSEFTVADNRSVSVTVAMSAPKPPPGPPIHVEGRVVDAAGKPVGDVHVWAIQKTWPQNRYRQDALSTKTDAQGRFRFDKFATARSQYAFLVTVIADGYAMTSEYQVVKDGSQKDPITLKLEPSEPVIIEVQDAAGKSIEGIEVSPAERKIDESKHFLNYSMHMKDTAKKTDARGEVSFTAWRPGESGTVFYRWQEKVGELQFKVGDSRRVTIMLPRE
jgi:serine/threonine protein kinase/uncharacterized GH25 family protein